MTAAIGRGAFGDLVATLQRSLARLGYYTGGIDGDFGGGTERAVMQFQADRRLRKTGFVTQKTWVSITGAMWPELFERCLQVTARFEGHGYGTLAGNFDGAGLTWGIIGFTLKHGGIQAIVQEIDATDPTVLGECFGSAADELRARMKSPVDASLTAWTDSISLGANKYGVQEPWRSGFARLGANPNVRKIQRQRARLKYFEPAVLTSKRLQAKSELSSELGIGLCFDIHVQNGGVDPAETEMYKRRLASLGKKATDAERRLALARVIADTSTARYRDDVYARKSTWATGEGLVHGQLFKLASWGMSEKGKG